MLLLFYSPNPTSPCPWVQGPYFLSWLQHRPGNTCSHGLATIPQLCQESISSRFQQSLLKFPTSLSHLIFWLCWIWLHGKILWLWEPVSPKKSQGSAQVNSLTRSSWHLEVDERVTLVLICYYCFYLTTLISSMCFLSNMHFLAILIISTCKQGTDQKASSRKSYIFNINLLLIFFLFPFFLLIFI